MAKQAETLFKERVVRKLKLIPNLWILKVQMVATIGIPDIIMCCNGKFIAWELKTLTGKVSKLQQHNLDSIADAKGIARVVNPDNLEECLKELRSLL